MPKINLILIGNQGSGKTSFVNRYVFDENENIKPDKMFSHKYYPTIGINLERKIINIESNDGVMHEVNLHIWDTAGQEKFFSLTKSYFRQADGVLVMFDITDKSSFFKIEEFWMKQIDENCKPETERVLVGNKVDLTEQRVIDKETGEKLANKFHIPYFEVSAKLGDGINEAMNILAKRCLNSVLAKVNTTKKKSNNIELTDSGGEYEDLDCLGKLRNVFGAIKSKFTK